MLSRWSRRVGNPSLRAFPAWHAGSATNGAMARQLPRGCAASMDRELLLPHSPSIRSFTKATACLRASSDHFSSSSSSSDSESESESQAPASATELAKTALLSEEAHEYAAIHLIPRNVWEQGTAVWRAAHMVEEDITPKQLMEKARTYIEANFSPEIETFRATIAARCLWVSQRWSNIYSPPSERLIEEAKAAFVPLHLLPTAGASFRKDTCRDPAKLRLTDEMIGRPYLQVLEALPSEARVRIIQRNKPSEYAKHINDTIERLACELEGLVVQGIVAAAAKHPSQKSTTLSQHKAAVDFRSPQDWYPAARKIKRTIVYHAGPTNSGKTYNALNRLCEAESGIYCSPLRMLAFEAFEKLNVLGAYTSLITGQEKEVVPFSSHVACTVEMANLEKEYDVAVIDEIQLLADSERGWAWTRALLGLPAKEIHVCGDPTAVGLVQRLADLCNDKFEVKYYDRLNKLQIAPSLKGNLKKIEKGDCLVAFSRKDIFNYRHAIENAGKHRCCVVYGKLPSEIRVAQARLFNSSDSQYEVLVGSDAIGLGLNLNIRRIVFTTMEKYHIDSVSQLPVSLVKQIAGRAGRASSEHEVGYVTTLQDEDLPYLVHCLNQDLQPTKKAGIMPSSEQIAKYSSAIGPSVPLHSILDRIAESSVLADDFFMCRLQSMQAAAKLLSKVPNLRMEDRYTLCCAPIRTNDPELADFFLQFASAVARQQSVPLSVHVPLWDPKVSRIRGVEEASDSLKQFESRGQALDLYMWLGQRFPLAFKDLGLAKRRREDLIRGISEQLAMSYRTQDRRMQQHRPMHRGRGRQRR